MGSASATQLLTARIGAAFIDERLVAHETEPCAICAGPSESGVPIQVFVTDSLTDQNTFRSPASAHVCASCAFVRARLSPVPGRPPKACDRCNGTGIEPAPGAGVKVAKRPKRKPGEVCEKCDGTKLKEGGGRFGNFSHFMDAERYENASKGEKPRILSWLRGAKVGAWFCTIADSGQKHLLPYAPVNPPGARGRVRFEEQEVSLPGVAGFTIVDAMTELLTMGATKEELETGSYSARAWSLCGDGLRAFETEHGGGRGGAWFALAVWLAQRDEERVAARMTEEKEAKKNGARRSKERAVADAVGGDAVGVSARVPGDVAGEGVGALAHPARQDADQRTHIEKRGRVGKRDGAAPPDPKPGQLDMFGTVGTVVVRPRRGRVG